MADSTEAVTMDKIVSLCKRRGFVFPSSEIYGGLGSTYDYGHYGVLMKNNIRAQWFRSMVQERDDMVALDSAVILNPKVWEASGHVAGFSDPLVDCKTCKLRFRADRLEDAHCGKRPSKRPGEDAQCDLTEARQFNLMFETQVGAMEDGSSKAYLRPETAQGIFINFKNVMQLARRKPPFGIAQTGKSFRNEITPGNFLFRVREFEQMEMEYFVPPDEAQQWCEYWVEQRFQWYLDLGLRREHAAHPRARGRRAVALLERHERHRVPLPHRLAGARGRRKPRRLRPDAAHRALGNEARVGRPGRRALHAARRRAGGEHRADLRRDARRRLRRGGRRRSRAHRAAPASADRADQGGDPAADREERRDGHEGACAAGRSCGSGHMVEYDDGGQIGRRYRRQDEIGTPWAFTIDDQTLEDDTVTVRERDSLAQERLPLVRRP